MFDGDFLDKDADLSEIHRLAAAILPVYPALTGARATWSSYRSDAHRPLLLRLTVPSSKSYHYFSPLLFNRIHALQLHSLQRCRPCL